MSYLSRRVRLLRMENDSGSFPSSSSIAFPGCGRADAGSPIAAGLDASGLVAAAAIDSWCPKGPLPCDR